MGERCRVLLVGDIVEDTQLLTSQSPFDHDMPTYKEVKDIADWLKVAGYDVEVQDRVRSFVDTPLSQPAEIVFPLWRAGRSRNRTAVVPAVCEARGLRYVGGDVLVHAACQHKSLSKSFVRSAGMKTPDDVVIWSLLDVARLRVTDTLPPPVVVKPLYSACSIGIDETSLCRTDEEIRGKAGALFDAGLGPVICETFIAGDEVCLCVLECRGQIVEKCVAVYRDAAGGCPFQNGLLTFDAKIRSHSEWAIKEDSKLIDVHVWERAESLLKILGRVDLLRIDGRLSDGEFIVTEITPDIHLGTESPFLGGFHAMGKSVVGILDRLVQVSLENQLA